MKLDYSSLSVDPACLEAESDPHAVKIIGGYSSDLGLAFATQVQQKGPSDKYAVAVLSTFIERQGLSALVIQTDNEPAVRSFVRAVKQRATIDISLRASPGIGIRPHLAPVKPFKALLPAESGRSTEQPKANTGYEFSRKYNISPGWLGFCRCL